LLTVADPLLPKPASKISRPTPIRANDGDKAETLRRPAGTTFPDSDAYALFAQDSWRPSDRLTLDYGVRWDLFIYAGNDVRNPDPGLASVGLATGVMPRDWNDVAGRFGFAFRPARGRQLIVRGGAGTFYGVLPGLVARTIQAQNGIQVATFTLTGDAVPPSRARSPFPTSASASAYRSWAATMSVSVSARGPSAGLGACQSASTSILPSLRSWPTADRHRRWVW